jgi:hypothetical protein
MYSGRNQHLICHVLFKENRHDLAGIAYSVLIHISRRRYHLHRHVKHTLIVLYSLLAVFFRVKIVSITYVFSTYVLVCLNLLPLLPVAEASSAVANLPFLSKDMYLFSNKNMLKVPTP